MDLRWFVRMARWAHRPPSAGMVRLVLGIVAVALVLAGIEMFLGWPDWLTVNSGGSSRMPMPR